MKNFRKVFMGMLVTIMAVSMLVSCGGPKASPEESAKVFLDVVLKDDKTNMSKIGLKEEDFTKFKKAKEEGITQVLTSTGLNESILTDEVKTKFKDNIFKGLSTLTYEVTPVSTEGDTAKVSIKIKAFDMEKITTDAQSALMEKLFSNLNMTEQEIYKESFMLIGDAIAAGTVKDEPKTIEMTLTKQSNVWLPNDQDIEKIMTAVMS